MISALIASCLLSLHVGDVCQLPANVALVEPGRLNWILKEKFFRIPEPFSAMVMRINPEGVEGVVELKPYYGANHLGWVESRNLVAIRDTLPVRPVVPGDPVDPPRSLASSPIKSYGVVVKKVRRKPDFSMVDAAIEGMAASTIQPRGGFGFSSGMQSGGYYTGPRQPPGYYLGGQGSSHKGGTYINPNTGNRYQKGNR